ncbi:alpha-mannosidase [Alkalinema pantanalense CENA528]|uniref:alpha-mannosidase n=1 Tax=Alkalinema pantanalense TaxID=1620705 RepID=UPI003D6F093C
MTNLPDSIELATQILNSVIQALRNQVQQDTIAHWQIVTNHVRESESGHESCGNALPLASPSDRATLAIPNEKGHIAWDRGRQEIVLRQVFQLPQCLDRSASGSYDLTGLTARLCLTWWAELAEVWVNGEKVQEGDLFDHSARIVLSRAVQPGEIVEITLRLVSPGHDNGALMRSRLIFESAYDSLDPGFVADEFAVVTQYLTTFAPEELSPLAQQIHPPTPFTPRTLVALRNCLLPYRDRLKDYTIYLLGHAHLDMAWLWTVEETWKAAERTFRSALQLQQEFPQLTFCHTTPALYEWMEQHRPALFHAICQRVQAGQWEPVGGLWIEPELNVIGGESIARQILYGQRYYQSRFGNISSIAWLPDTFGFCWQFPQLLQQGGMNYFVTQKLRWNDTTKYPHEVFIWQAPDGSQVTALMSAPIGEGIDPIKLSDYCWEWQQKTGDRMPLWLTGIGDHGGGPTRDMLDLATRWQRSPYFPNLEFTTAETYCDRLQSSLSTTALPVWNSDLYLEFHRGCYTTHADQKAWNRDCEDALYCAELWASLACLAIDQPYPKPALETAWKQVLFNQFHDILPGTSIAEVYPTANQAWEQAYQQLRAITTQARQAIAQAIQPFVLPSGSTSPNDRIIVVFNDLSWQRSEWVRLFIPELAGVNPEQFVDAITVHPPKSPFIRGTLKNSAESPKLPLNRGTLKNSGNNVQCQIRSHYQDGRSGWLVEFWAEAIPAMGYRCYSLSIENFSDVVEIGQESATESCNAIFDGNQDYQLENQCLRVVVDSETGNITELFDKVNCQNVLNGDGNALLSFQDQGQYWDAWNIDPDYKNYPLPPAQLQSIEWLEQSPARSRLRVVRTIGQSTFTQIYALEAHSPLLEIQNQVDWQEKHVLVKAAFPVNFSAEMVSYETACGVIDRPTRPATEAEKAQWEVPGLRWASLSGEIESQTNDQTSNQVTYGLSILSDRKHGYNHQPNEIRLSLSRAPEWPDPQADQGHHAFTYYLYPHAGNWQTAKTPQKAMETTLPLQAIVLPAQALQGNLPSSGSLLTIPTENLMPMVLKQAEDNPEQYILRCYEWLGESAELEIGGLLKLQVSDRVDLLEGSLRNPDPTIYPWQIASFSLSKFGEH